MNANLRILEASPGAELTALTLSRYLDASQGGIGRTMWLVPTELAASEIRGAIARSGKSILSPNVVCFRELQSTPISALAFRRRMTLEHVTRALHEKNKLKYFARVSQTRGFRDGAMEMIAELESAAVDADSFRKALGRTASEKLNECQQIFREFRKEFKEPGEAAWPARFANVRAVFVSGFAAFHESELDSLKTIAEHASELWIALPEIDLARGEISQRVQRTRDTLIERFGEPARDRGEAAISRPPALSHLLAGLFAEDRGHAISNSAGISFLEAPGEVGEARMIARRIRTLLDAGTSADEIVVTARDLTHSFRLLEEVFAEYGIAADVFDEEPLAHVPAVRTLLHALRLQDEDFPFAGVSALLRSTYLRPAWIEAADEMPLKAEGLLRMLGEPRSRVAYLKAVDIWHHSPPPPLEDEHAEEPLRIRKSRMAGDCEPFFKRFFMAWEILPERGTPKQFVEAARRFSEELGIAKSADADRRDREALRKLWQTMAPRNAKPISRQQFLQSLNTAAASESLTRWTGQRGRVRILPAEEAKHIDCGHLFIIGLGEGSFPKMSGPASLFDDGDRHALRTRGLYLPDPSLRMGDEQLLMLELISRVRTELILSYPALDDKGQPMLPGSFLRLIRDCFEPGAIMPERQSMLVEGYMKHQPLSAAEMRVQFAAGRSGRKKREWNCKSLPSELTEQLRWTADIANERFRSKEFGRYDGWTDGERTVAYINQKLGANKVFSPTALETYVACPFKFLMEHVLRLGELEEPDEEIEQTRRGSAYHRALSRLHAHLNEHDPTMPQRKLPDVVGERLLVEMNTVIGEQIDRAPSAASKRLWELEGKRLHRSVVRYQPHWDEFLDPWRKRASTPLPTHFEAGFGFKPAPGEEPRESLVINIEGVEVRIGGRIDRVDVTQFDDGVGFWIIDYKTGRASNYTGADLVRMEKLQLPLYALAIERIFYPEQKARPIGLAYWLVTDTGVKQALPKKSAEWFEDADVWPKFREQLEHWVAKLVGRIRLGQFPLAPRSEHCTDTCAYSEMCRISQSRGTGKEFDLKLPGEAE